MPISQGNVGTGLNAQHRVYSNYFSDESIIQNVAIIQPKNLLIDVLRKHFSNDNIYTYRSDEYGFPLTVDLTGKTRDDEDTTKILISDLYGHEVKFYPAITVKSGGGKYKPISFNQNETTKYRKDIVVSDFGQQTVVSTPTHTVYAGAWEQSFDVTIYSESHSELEELTEAVLMRLQYSSWNELRENGLFINATSFSGENSQPYANDYVYIKTITLQTWSEWRVEIPLDNVIEKVLFYFESTRTPCPPKATATDLLELQFEDIVELAELE